MTSSEHTQNSPLKIILQAEGAAIAALCVWAFAALGGSWWLFALLILAPDLFMLGYLAGNRIGAACYNIAHSYLGAAALGAFGYATQAQTLILLALIWGAHIGADRAIGYGLKYAAGFRQTHLGRI